MTRPRPRTRRPKKTARDVAPRAFLAAHGLDVSPAGLDRLVAAAVAELPRALYPVDPRHDLTVAERAALERGGLDPEPRDLGDEDPLARTAADYAALLRASRTVAEAARVLGVNESRIRQRLTSRPPTLYGFKLEGEWRIPDFLFDGRRLVPGVAAIAAALDPAVHPVAFFRWFTAPDSDLVVGPGEKPVSPRSWLIAAHPPEVAAALASEV